MNFDGIYTAMVTPFDADGRLDLAAFRKLLEAQIAGGVSGVVICGTTGESPALDMSEKHTLVKTALDVTSGTNVSTLVGTGSNHTPLTIEFSKWASDQGVAGVLVVTPYYSKPTQAGLRDHFLAVADEIDCDLVLYNVPGRTAVTITPGTVAHLAQHPRITALKDATGDIGYAEEVLDELIANDVQMSVLSGDDPSLLAHMAIGGKGSVSVASNIIPAQMVAMHKAVMANDINSAREINSKYYTLFRDLFVETNPAPIKYALSLSGYCQSVLRHPLAQMEPVNVEKLRKTLNHVGLPS